MLAKLVRVGIAVALLTTFFVVVPSILTKSWSLAIVLGLAMLALYIGVWAFIIWLRDRRARR